MFSDLHAQQVLQLLDGLLCVASGLQHWCSGSKLKMNAIETLAYSQGKQLIVQALPHRPVPKQLELHSPQHDHPGSWKRHVLKKLLSRHQSAQVLQMSRYCFCSSTACLRTGQRTLDAEANGNWWKTSMMRRPFPTKRNCEHLGQVSNADRRWCVLKLET